MTKHFFITATDTDAGKTYVSCLIIKALVKQSYKIAVFKPISAGCSTIAGKLVNPDALLLQQYANCQQTIEEINPIAFEQAIAPHIAAKKQQQTIELSHISHSYKQVCQHHSDIIISEGAGGWRLPLGQGKFLSDFAKATKQNVILVVNIKLGCLNHAILTYESIIADGLNCIAWVANSPKKDNSSVGNVVANITELNTLLPIPLLGKLNYQMDLERAIKQLNITLLL